MAISVLGGQPAARTLAELALARARRAVPTLGRSGQDIAIITVDGRGYDPSSLAPSTHLVVMTAHPSVVQAAAAMIVGALAYLPCDLDPAHSAAALQRVTRGLPHIEPETAAVLRELTRLTGGTMPGAEATDMMLLLTLRARGHQWADAADSVGIDPRDATRWLEQFLGSIRRSSRNEED